LFHLCYYLAYGKISLCANCIFSLLGLVRQNNVGLELAIQVYGANCLFSAPKGTNNIAQGNALGINRIQQTNPEGVI